MKRRTILQWGALTATALVTVGIGVGWRNGPGWKDGRLGPIAGQILRPLGDALLDGLLPIDPTGRNAVLDRWLEAVQRTVAALPTAAQAEFSQMIAVLAHPVGRWGLAHLSTPWQQASRPEVTAALEAMRQASLAAPQQIYHALRDLAAAAYAADPAHWPLMHYPGPVPLSERVNAA